MNLLRLLFVLSTVFINQQTINACTPPAPLKPLEEPSPYGADSKTLRSVRFTNMTKNPVLLGDLELGSSQTVVFVNQNIDTLSDRFPTLEEDNIRMTYAVGCLTIVILESQRISPHGDLEAVSPSDSAISPKCSNISPYGDITPGFAEHTPTPDEDRISPSSSKQPGMRRAASCPSLAAKAACCGRMIAGAVVTVRS